jgi:hypothetical protein
MFLILSDELAIYKGVIVFFLFLEFILLKFEK